MKVEKGLEAASTSDVAKRRRQAERARFTLPRLDAAARAHGCLAQKMPLSAVS